jgi:hypothetical protein
MTSLPADEQLCQMDDNEFMSACRTAHRVAELTPDSELPAEARARLAAVEAESTRRAGLAWQRVS